MTIPARPAKIAGIMKLYIILTLTAVIMAFATGYSLLFLRGPEFSTTPSDLISILQVKKEFLRQVSPITSIDFSNYYPTEEHLSLLLPHDSVSIASKKQGADETNYSKNEHCFDHVFKYLNVKNYQKLWVWEEFRCGLRDKLPINYFSYPPFIHPSGASYVYLALYSDFEEFHSVGWVKEHLPLFHVQELSDAKNFLGGTGLGRPFIILEGLGAKNLQALLAGKSQILTRNYFLVKVQYIFANSVFKYRVFLKEDLDEFLRETPYEISPLIGNGSKNKNGGLFKKSRCLLQDDNICWSYNARHFFQMAYDSSFYFFIGSLCIVLLVVWSLLSRIRSAKLEEERRRLALQVLTHEFRTPVSSMLLQRERLHNQFDLLPGETQEVVLRLSDDIFRLQRLVEKSRSYLRMSHGKGLITFNRVEVASVNEFFTNLMIPYEEQGEITLHLLDEDRPFSIDTYWVSICFNNLIENAKHHGEKPIDIFLSFHKNVLDVIVQDVGPCEFHSLSEMVEPFVKGNRSQGTGLGLNLVYKIAHEMGGYLIFKQHPKRFILGIR